uniref:Uncharacterized protein n=1 Tax=Anguilla anguilla TaxID=7936 RepID=A0A0E9VYE1_ANGAN
MSLFNCLIDCNTVFCILV